MSTEEEIVYLVAIIKKNSEYEDVQNYLFRSREDAVNLIKKDYYLKPNKKRWKNSDGSVNALIIELILR